MKIIKSISIMILLLAVIFMTNNVLYAEGIPLFSQLVFYADFESDTPGSLPDTSLTASSPPFDTIILRFYDGDSVQVVADHNNNWLEIVQGTDNADPERDKAFFYGKLDNVQNTLITIEDGQYTLAWTSSLQAAGSGVTGAGFGNAIGDYSFAVIYGADGMIRIKSNDVELYDTGVEWKLGEPQTFWVEMNVTEAHLFTLYIDGVPVKDGDSLKHFAFNQPLTRLVKFAATIGPDATYRIDNIMMVQHTSEPPVPVEIDIKPSSDADCKSIKLDSNGVVPMAIFGSDTFDATMVIPSTVLLTGAVVKSNHEGDYLCYDEDIDQDGFVDKICKINTKDLLILHTGELYAVLEAEMLDGTQILGIERICVKKEKNHIDETAKAKKAKGKKKGKKKDKKKKK